MSRKPELPSGRQRGLPLVVPDDWTPEQALAVFELLEDLQAVITGHYGVELHDLLRAQRQPVVAARRTDKGSPF